MQSNHVHSHSHTHNKKKHHSQKNWLERIFSGRILLILGITFLFIGLYYSISSTGYLNHFYSKLLNFFKPSLSQGSEIKGSGFAFILLYLCVLCV